MIPNWAQTPFFNVVANVYVSPVQYNENDPRLKALEEASWAACLSEKESTDDQKLQNWNKLYNSNWLFPQLLQCANELIESQETNPVELLLRLALVADRYAKDRVRTTDRNHPGYLRLFEQLDAATPEILNTLFNQNENIIICAHAYWNSSTHKPYLEKRFKDPLDEMQRICQFTGSKEFYEKLIKTFDSNSFDSSNVEKVNTITRYLDKFKWSIKDENLRNRFDIQQITSVLIKDTSIRK
jgi:hypothetical protein